MSNRPTPAKLAMLFDLAYSRKALNESCSPRVFCGCRLEGNNMSDSQKRRREKAIKVWVTEDEKALIESASSDCGQSASSYLRALGTGYMPPSKIDKNHVLELTFLIYFFFASS